MTLKVGDNLKEQKCYSAVTLFYLTSWIFQWSKTTKRKQINFPIEIMAYGLNIYEYYEDLINISPRI